MNRDQGKAPAINREMSLRRRQFARLLMTMRSRRNLYEQLGELGQSGMREYEMIELVWRVRNRDPVRGRLDPVVHFCEDALHGLGHEGRTLPEVVLRWAGNIERPLLAAAAASGATSALYASLIQLMDDSLRIREALLELAASVAILVGVVAGTGGFLAYYFEPAIAAFIDREQLQGSARTLVREAVRFREHWLVALVVAVVAGAGVTASLPLLTGAMRNRIDRLEPWRTYRQVTGGSFLIAASTLFGAGLNEREALRILRRNARPYLSERLRLLERLDGSLGSRLGQLGEDWPDAESHIETVLAAEQPNPVLAYARAGSRLLNRTVQRCRRFSRMGGLIANVVLTAMIIWILVATNDISASFQSAQAGLP